MDLYRHYVAPRVVDLACSSKGMAKWRARCVEDLAGTVVEIGFGAGRNLVYYPPSVTEVIAVEPSPVMRRRAERQLAAADVRVRWGGLDGQRLDLEDDTVDAGVVTFALCTIPDPVAALDELRRVVRPGGQLRVLEHGLAPDESVARWQRRLNGVERRLADGCQLVHDPVASVAAAGWTITATYQRYSPGPKPWSYFTSLRAS
jgi:ubiquinone/menaquinone biosynthesis C-methylase UbiE